MTRRHLVTRRMLLRDMGRAGVAVMVLGFGACATDPTEAITRPRDTETSTTRPVTSTSPTTSPTTVTSSAESVRERNRWHRVDLGVVSAFILYRDGEAAVVDTGVQGSEGSIGSALGELGLGWESVGHVILTHKHPDHQGSVEAVLNASDAPWHAGAGDLQAVVASRPGNEVGDGDRVFDLQIIETPGHTPGHICVLDQAAGVLVAGDALNGASDGVRGPDARFTEDMGLANASVVKLAGFDYEVALFGHGEPVVEAASARVDELADALSSGRA